MPISENEKTPQAKLFELMTAVNGYSQHNPMAIEDINSQFKDLRALLGTDNTNLIKIGWEWEARQQKFRHEQDLISTASSKLLSKHYPKEFSVTASPSVEAQAQPASPKPKESKSAAVTFSPKRDRDWPPQEKPDPDKENVASPANKKPKHKR